MIARDSLRGVEKSWAKALYGIALRPHLILYLRASVPSLVQRLIHGRGLNYWEAGMDLNLADNLYDSFVLYQTEVIKELEELALEYNFLAIDADRSPGRSLKIFNDQFVCSLRIACPKRSVLFRTILTPQFIWGKLFKRS